MTKYDSEKTAYTFKDLNHTGKTELVYKSDGTCGDAGLTGKVVDRQIQACSIMAVLTFHGIMKASTWICRGEKVLSMKQNISRLK